MPLTISVITPILLSVILADQALYKIPLVKHSNRAHSYITNKNCENINHSNIYSDTGTLKILVIDIVGNQLLVLKIVYLKTKYFGN